MCTSVSLPVYPLAQSSPSAARPAAPTPSPVPPAHGVLFGAPTEEHTCGLLKDSATLFLKRLLHVHVATYVLMQIRVEVTICLDNHQAATALLVEQMTLQEIRLRS